MELIPEVPDACDPSVVEAQQSLIIVADAIEALTAQIGWLEPELTMMCNALTPEFEAIVNGGNNNNIILAQVSAQHTDPENVPLLDSLFVMEGQPGEDIDAFTGRISLELQGLIDGGDVQASDVGVTVAPVSELCPSDVLDAHAVARDHVANLVLQATMTGWLEGRIAQTCDSNAAVIDDLITTNSEGRDAAIVAAFAELQTGQPILGEENEDLEAFSKRLQE